MVRVGLFLSGIFSVELAIYLHICEWHGMAVAKRSLTYYFEPKSYHDGLKSRKLHNFSINVYCSDNGHAHFCYMFNINKINITINF